MNVELAPLFHIILERIAGRWVRSGLMMDGVHIFASYDSSCVVCNNFGICRRSEKTCCCCYFREGSFEVRPTISVERCTRYHDGGFRACGP